MATVTRDGGSPAPRLRARQGPDAGDFLQRMVSNDVPAGTVCEALLLTAKARVIAPLLVWRRGDDDFLLLTEPELGEVRARAAHPHALRGEMRDRVGGAHLDGRLRRASGRASRTATTASRRSSCSTRTSTPTLDGRRPGTAADRGRHAAVRPRDRRPRPAGRGRSRRARRLVHEGLLPGPGADRAPALPRQGEPAAARARASTAAAPAPRPRSCTAARTSAASRARCPASALAYVRVEVPEDAELDVRPALRPGYTDPSPRP